MHANGNVIMIVDETISGLPAEDVDPVLARQICQTFHSVRIDGIAFLRTTADTIKMTYFERDGTHSSMCGNALRCSARYSHELGYLSEESVIATDDGDKWVSVGDGWVRAALGEIRDFKRLDETRYFAFSGLPHVVCLVPSLATVDVKRLGAALRYDRNLCTRVGHPEGVHVDFVQRNPKGISVRTYEVGVEDETLSCGTGVAASAYIANKAWRVSFPLFARTRGGPMMVEDSQHGLTISGTVEYLFSNVIWPGNAEA